VPADPPDSVPGDAKREVLDLRYVVEGTAAQVQDLKVRESDLEVQIELPADVLFDFDNDRLRPTAKASLDRAAEVIKEKSKGPIRITGYTDAKGNDNYNKKLSERRANAVRDYFVKEAGLRGKPFKTQGLGAANPVAPNAKPDGSDDPEGRQKNRRVEIVIRKKG
jgi:outer membrane protein OmpA-like peptidoglycan-associated protein